MASGIVDDYDDGYHALRISQMGLVHSLYCRSHMEGGSAKGNNLLCFCKEIENGRLRCAVKAFQFPCSVPIHSLNPVVKQQQGDKGN